jgi:serine/threonine-protein kinase
MAPEQCQGKKDVDPRADIYSLGVIFFQALTAQYPFDDESYPMLVLKICTEPPPSLAHYRPDLPPQLQDIVNGMLAKNRANRPSSCAEVKAALAPYAHMNDAPVVTANAPSTAARGPSVLMGAAGPAVTPTGTAFLPGTPAPGATPYPVQEKSGSGLLFAMIGAIGLLVVAGAAFGIFMALRDDAPETHATRDEPATPPDDPTPPAGNPPVVAPPENPAATEATPVPSTPPVPSAAMVHVTLTAVPAEATIVFDDVPYPSPFAADVERGGHHLVVRADGYETQESNPRYIADVSQTIALVRQRGRSSASRASTASTVGQVHPVGGGATTTGPVEHRAPTPFDPPRPRPRGDTLVGGTDIFGNRAPAH